MRRIVFITNGFSFILKSLVEEQSVLLSEVMDFNSDAVGYPNTVINNGISYYAYDNNIEHLEKRIKLLKPELLVVYKMPFLLPENIFSFPEFGSINIHPSLLPKYRGPNPWFWTYFNMENAGGMTIHRIDKYEDHGDILAQNRFEIHLGDELHHLQLKAEQMIYPVLLDIIKDINIIEGKPQIPISKMYRAPNIFDYSSIINLNEMDGFRIWHLLRGFPQLLPLMIEKCEYQYKIKNFIFDPNVGKNNAGKIVIENENTYLCCVNGKIILENL